VGPRAGLDDMEKQKFFTLGKINSWERTSNLNFIDVRFKIQSLFV
jgi:hypothetical protein